MTVRTGTAIFSVLLGERMERAKRIEPSPRARKGASSPASAINLASLLPKVIERLSGARSYLLVGRVDRLLEGCPRPRGVQVLRAA
jgi:hypothetical protein